MKPDKQPPKTEEPIKPTCCIDLCEFGAALDGAAAKKDAHVLEEFISACCSEAGFPECARIYLGSSFCVNAFMHLGDDLLDALVVFCKDYAVPVTLVLPIVTEGNQQRFKERLSAILGRADCPVDELTVNDYGMLDYVSSHCALPINLGRLFSKDLRDPRYPETFRTSVKPAILTGELARIRAAYPRVAGIELDPMASAIDIKALPTDIALGLHFPLCYVSTGHLCEVAAQGRELTGKFHAEAPCADECVHADVCYTLRHSQGGDGFNPPSIALFKHGKTVYYPNYEARVVNANAYRLVYLPDRFGWSAQDAVTAIHASGDTANTADRPAPRGERERARARRGNIYSERRDRSHADGESHATTRAQNEKHRDADSHATTQTHSGERQKSRRPEQSRDTDSHATPRRDGKPQQGGRKPNIDTESHATSRRDGREDRR